MIARLKAAIDGRGIPLPAFRVSGVISRLSVGLMDRRCGRRVTIRRRLAFYPAAGIILILFNN
jgi:hypothetical protein